MTTDGTAWVAAKVASLRKRAAMSQVELARLLSERLGKHVDPTTVTRLESGRRPITVTELIALSRALGVPLASLLPTTERAVISELRYWKDKANAELRQLQELSKSIDNSREMVSTFRVLVQAHAEGDTGSVRRMLERIGEQYRTPAMGAVLAEIRRDCGVNNDDPVRLVAE